MSRRFGHVDIPFKRIHIELTNKCDFNCVFCPKAEMRRPYGKMDTGLAKRLLDEIRREGMADKVTFHVMGEPTLHPDFFEILQHAQDIGQPVGLTTNAGGLARGMGDRLLDFELHQIDASLQTPDPDSFRLRKAGKLKYEDYENGILEFYAAYRKRWPDTILKLRFLNTRFPPKALEKHTGETIRVMSNTRELRETFARWVGRVHDLMETGPELRATVAKRIKSLRAWKWNVVEILPNTFFETYILSDWGHAFGGGKIRDAWGGFCFGMRDHFAILWNGDLILCCTDYDGETVVGNVTDTPIKNVLSNELMGRVMRKFRRFQLELPYCKRCLGSQGMVSWLFKPVAGIAALHLLKPYFYNKCELSDTERALK